MRRCTQRSAGGFTLIELMIVLVIVGLMAGGISLGLDSLRGRDEAQVAERLQHVLAATADRAMTRGQVLAIELLADGYRFRQRDSAGNWQRLDDPPVFAGRRFPAGFAWQALARDGQSGLAAGQRLVFALRPPEYRLALLTPQGTVVYRGLASGEVAMAGAAAP